MLASDVFVIRDDVQFVRGHKFPDGSRGVSHQVHAPVKAPGGVHAMAVSVKKSSRSPINRTYVSYEQRWVRKHTNVISNFYASATNARALLPEIESLLRCRFSTVADLDIATLCWAMSHVMGVKPRIPDELSIERVNELLETKRPGRLRRIVLGSELFQPGAEETASASERIVFMCKAFGAVEYMGGRTAVDAYMDTELLRRNGIELVIQDWQCPTYRQQHMAKAGFIANLSILDLLMNAPAEELASMLGCG